MRNMNDIACFNHSGAAQDEIMVLASFEPRPEPTRCSHDCGVEYAKMRKKVLLQNKFGIPVCLEVRSTSTPCRRDLVLVTIEQAGMRIRFDVACHDSKRMTRQHIVVIQ
ncbi:hypothetical protein WS58_00025 [Burkholderia pseudomultivorans]|nr:hypothetical protein WS58_00025 [Burkholderia pseudomultivorans]